jgi:hypothetical protein
MREFVKSGNRSSSCDCTARGRVVVLHWLRPGIWGPTKVIESSPPNKFPSEQLFLEHCASPLPPILLLRVFPCILTNRTIYSSPGVWSISLFIFCPIHLWGHVTPRVSNLMEQKVPSVPSEIPGMAIVLPITCWKYNLVTFKWWRNDVRHFVLMMINKLKFHEINKEY